MPQQKSQLRSPFKLAASRRLFSEGIATVLIGQLLPILVQKLEINDRQAGDFFIAQFAGNNGFHESRLSSVSCSEAGSSPVPYSPAFLATPHSVEKKLASD